MNEQKKLEAIQKIYAFAEAIQEENGFTDAEMVQIIEQVREGF